MKVFVVISLFVAIISAEPPNYRQQHQPASRQYYMIEQQEEQAPYPASGWKPDGPAFKLPQRVQNAPQQKYGVPESTTGYFDATEREESTTVSSDSEPVTVKRLNELAEEDLDLSQPQEKGEYYIALPDGRLQRIQYVSSHNLEAMKYFAKLRAENVEPLRGPIYSYAPLQKLQIPPSGLQVDASEEPKSGKYRGTPAKLEIQPVTQVQYQHDNPTGVIPLSNGPNAPVSSSFTTYTANYQTPSLPPRYILAL